MRGGTEEDEQRVPVLDHEDDEQRVPVLDHEDDEQRVPVLDHEDDEEGERYVGEGQIELLEGGMGGGGWKDLWRSYPVRLQINKPSQKMIKTVIKKMIKKMIKKVIK